MESVDFFKGGTACENENMSSQTRCQDQSGTSSGVTFKSQYEIPTNEKGYTKSSLDLGKKVHKEYMSDVADDVNKIK